MGPLAFTLPWLVAGLLGRPDASSDRARLLDGVEALEQVGVPGPVVVFGPRAFAVLTAANGEAVVAATRYGEGRVVAFGHGSYLSPAAGEEGRRRLFANAIRWAAGGASAPVVVDVRRPEGLAGADVVTWAGGDVPPQRCEELSAFVRSGGGLVVGECPWGWQQLHPRLVLREEAPSNRVLAPMGLVFGPTTLGGGPYAVAASRPDQAHAGARLAALARGDGADGGDGRGGAVVLERALQSVPSADTLFLPRVEAFLEEHPSFAVPRETAPLHASDVVSRLRVAYWTRKWEDTPAGELEAAPGAEFFPGAPPDGAPRITRVLEPDPERTGWIGTGVYAPPGELVRVRVRDGAASGWFLRIGAHTDSIARHEAWKRWPVVTRRFELAGRETDVASPFGGLIYLEAGPGAGPLRVELAGVVEAPTFELRRPPSEEEWRRRRAAPAPWAEIAGRHLVLTVPSAAIRELEDPARLARFWDAVVVEHRRLAARPLPERPERIVADVQISAGYMHAGYPIMTWLDVTRPSKGHALGLVVDAPRLEREGSWGHYHELGHNLQRGDWTFAGTGEVTCNLFALHAGDRLNDIEPWENPWLEGQKKKAAAYFEAGSPFDEWKRDPGLALLMYAQVQKAFGWEPFRSVFAEYEALAPRERPGGQGAALDRARRDQWFTRLSRATGVDLGPFFERWGVPVSAAARAAVADLAPWEPDWAELGNR